MFITNLNNKSLLKDSLCCNLNEGQIKSCVMDEMLFEGKKWTDVSITDCNINDAAFHAFSITGSTIMHSSLMKTKFNRTVLTGTNFNGDTLIRTDWKNCSLKELIITHCSMQRVTMSNCTVESSSFSDCECLYGILSNCIFKDCRFELDFNYGMNGFSGASIKNCLFINCNFKGFPMRGMNTDSCVFINCYGELTDDAECVNTVGLGRFSSNISGMTIANKPAALEFINEWK